jgi:hypothetical protein
MLDRATENNDKEQAQKQEIRWNNLESSCKTGSNILGRIT